MVVIKFKVIHFGCEIILWIFQTEMFSFNVLVKGNAEKRGFAVVGAAI